METIQRKPTKFPSPFTDWQNYEFLLTRSIECSIYVAFVLISVWTMSQLSEANVPPSKKEIAKLAFLFTAFSSFLLFLEQVIFLRFAYKQLKYGGRVQVPRRFANMITVVSVLVLGFIHVRGVDELQDIVPYFLINLVVMALGSVFVGGLVGRQLITNISDRYIAEVIAEQMKKSKAEEGGKSDAVEIPINEVD